MYKILNMTYSKMPTEEAEQLALVGWLKKNNIFFYATTNENNSYKQDRKYAMIAEVKAKANGKLKGVADLTIFLKDFVLFIELKRQRPILKNGELGTPTNKASDEQLKFIEKVSSYYYAKGFICFGCDEAIEKIKEFI